MHAVLPSVSVIFMTLNKLGLFPICPHPIVQPHSEPRPRWKRNELVMAAVYGEDKILNYLPGLQEKGLLQTFSVLRL